MPKKSRKLRCAGFMFALFIACAVSTAAQSTAFTYQGRFTDSTVTQPTDESWLNVRRDFCLNIGVRVFLRSGAGSVSADNG